MGKSRHRSRSRSPSVKRKRKSRSKSKKKERKHISSSSSTDSSSSPSPPKRPRSEEKKNHKRKKKHKHRSSSSSSSSSNSSSSADRKKHKKKKKKKKRKIKKVKKLKNCETIPVIDETGLDIKKKSKETKTDADVSSVRVMKPMTKEEWEKQQSVVRKVYDPETGRNRLVKGDGEILEEIVSKERHREINKQSTLGDGLFWQTKMGLNK